MKTLKDTKITIVKMSDRWQDDEGGWHQGKPVETTVWANCRGVKHSAYMAANAVREQPSLVATFELPRGMDLAPNDKVLAMGHEFKISHVDYLDMRGDVKIHCVDERRIED